MTRVECEKKIAEHLIEIRRIALEYGMKSGYLSMAMLNNKNGNDNGEWDAVHFLLNNAYRDETKDHVISFTLNKDIKDEKYWRCNTVEDDKEETAFWDERGCILTDDFWFNSDTWIEYYCKDGKYAEEDE